MELEKVFTVLSLVGLGGILGNYFRILWERQNSAQLQKQEFKEKRYKCVVILLLSYLDFEKSKPLLHLHGRKEINSIEDLKDELEVEWNNMILFASEDVLMTLRLFIKTPSKEKFVAVAVAMRNDLWGGKISLDKLL
ncbi:MAG: hypothetical protein HZA78_09195 [Candidatus Schekmanbacteria bacterium]|nr:hypothetical protein [Candidatus Schekmanbacteria bacterium]